MPDGLHHFDGDNFIVGAGEIAVIAELDVDAVGEAGGGNARAGEVVLLLGNRDGGDAAAVGLGGVEGPAAPAGADLEDVIGGGEAEGAAEGVVFLALGFLEGEVRVGGRPLRGGIHHRRVEKEREEIVGEIVVLGDVAAGDFAGVGAEEVAEAVGVAQEVEGKRLGVFFRRTGERGGIIDVEEKPGDDGGEVGCLPVAVDVGLGEADVAGEETFLEEGVPFYANEGERREGEWQRELDGGGVGADLVRGAVG